MQLIGHLHKRAVVVSCSVCRVHHDIHAERVFQIEERLLHVADYHSNVGDARFLQLANLALDEDFAAHLEQALRLFVRKRSKARGDTRRHNDGIVDLVRRQRGIALRGQAEASAKPSSAHNRKMRFAEPSDIPAAAAS